MPMPRLVILLAVLAVSGCGDDEGTSTTGTAPGGNVPETSAAASPGCVPVDSSLMTPLANGMRDEQVRLKNGRAVKSARHADVYFVSAELYGSDVSEGTIGTWATASLGGAEAIWTVDDVSKRYSDLRDGTIVADLSVDDDGAAESRACVESAP